MKHRILKSLAAGAVAVGLVGTSVAFAGGHSASPEERAVKARKAHMQLYAFNLGILGAMAKGEMDFNADIATEASGNLASLTTFGQMAYWPPGTTNADLGPEVTRALPAAWENIPDLISKGQAMAAAAAKLSENAGTLEGLQANMGDVGKACGACHKPYRAPQN